ncbi:hypothetical protein CNR22_12095 [Sphingobacteriaceae bacterium]|nr:hypothetical protein CNR22_12095 [Sphingobacteriaceae bacterium]
MKQFLLVLSLILVAFLCPAQKKTKGASAKGGPKVGDKIVESIPYFKDSATAATYQFPNDAFTLLYRFGEKDGTKDNYDSVYKMVTHVYRLNRYFGPRRKPSRLTCYMFVKEVNAEAIALKNKINAWTKSIGDSMVRTERAGFNFNRPWQVLFITNTQVGPTSILAAEKVSIVAADGVVLDSSPLGDFHFKGKKGSVKGKLLTEKETKKVPIPNVMVSLLNLKTGKEEADSALTDIYGDFEISVQDESADYSIIVKSHSTDVENVILATQSGQEISRLKRTSRGFEYKLIPGDIVLLTEKENEDITLLFNKFGVSKETDLKVSENILYALGQYKIEDAASKKILDKVVKILKENPKVTLQLISHTDAQGDDAFNMNLSEKRSTSVINYFIQKGIDKKRLTSIGKGETEIRNRCINDVDCSDKEHEYNRRTEFKFTKG